MSHRLDARPWSPSPEKPSIKPVRPEFSSGPCPKRPGWDAAAVSARAFLGRSHRAAGPKAQIRETIDAITRILGVPADYRVGSCPPRNGRGRDGAVVDAGSARRWTCSAGRASVGLGHGRGQAARARRLAVIRADYGELPDLATVDSRDVVFTWNGTTSGVRVPNADWIPNGSQGTHHLRRDLGGLCADPRLRQARHGDLVLAEGHRRRGRSRRARAAPRAVERLETSRRLGRCPRSSPDQGRKAHREHLPGRDDQHAFDALRRRCGRSPLLGGVGRRPEGG